MSKSLSRFSTIAATALVGLAGLFSQNALAQSSVSVSLPTLTATPGQTVTVPVTVGDLTGKLVPSYDFTLNYDSTKLTLASPSFDNAGTLSSSMTVTPNTSVNNKLTISAFGTSNLAGAGTLINLRFTVKDGVSGTAALTWQSFVFGEGDPTAAATGGSITIPAPGKPLADFNGDGKTDFSIIRTGGGAMTWWNLLNGPGTFSGAQWGASTDKPTPADFDGDSKSDFAVWRQGADDSSGFFILQSSNSTFVFERFGQAGDDPSVTGDYDGDGKADPAVFRCPAAPGGTCFFYYRGSNNNASRGITFIPWGRGTNRTDIFPVAGDFDGDGKFDFCVRINNGSGGGQFWVYKSSNGTFDVTNWGLITDTIIPRGDFDGDAKTDFGVYRIDGGLIKIFILERDGGGTGASPILWGGTGDEPAFGDYDGDGKTDVAIWRPSDGTFYANRSTGGFLAAKWGASGDYPVAKWTFPAQ